VTAVVALLLASMTTAAAPRPPWLTHHLTIPIRASGEILLTEQALYVAGWAGGGNWTLAAYRLSDGSVQWEVPLAALSREPSSATLFWFGMPVSVYSYVDDDGLPSFYTTAIDPDTGRELWTVDGFPVAPPLPDDRLLLLRYLPVPGGTEGAALVASLTVVDQETGTEEWTVPSTLLLYALDDGGRADRLVIIDTGGVLTSFDLTNGQPLASLAGVGFPEVGHLSVTGDLVLVQPRADESALRAYDVDTLAHRWTADLPAGGEAAQCGYGRCVRGETLVELDLATGEPVWSVDWPPRNDQGWRPSSRLPWLAGHVLANGWLIDAETGDPVLNLGEWMPQLPGVDRRLAVPGPGATLTRYESPDDGRAGRTWIGRLRLDPPGIDVLGTVDGGLFGCVVGTWQVVCEEEDEVTLWRRG
jgi:outer membrane protein assembly factor BamB